MAKNNSFYLRYYVQVTFIVVLICRKDLITYIFYFQKNGMAKIKFFGYIIKTTQNNFLNFISRKNRIAMLELFGLWYCKYIRFLSDRR